RPRRGSDSRRVKASSTSAWTRLLSRGCWRSPPRGWRICGTRCAASTRRSVWPRPPLRMRCSADLVVARIIEPTSKVDSLRVLVEVGIDPVSYRTLVRHLPACATQSWRGRLAAACAARAALGPAWLVLYDVSTLYFETPITLTGSASQASCKERCLEPQITIGLL